MRHCFNPEEYNVVAWLAAVILVVRFTVYGTKIQKYKDNKVIPYTVYLTPYTSILYGPQKMGITIQSAIPLSLSRRPYKPPKPR